MNRRLCIRFLTVVGSSGALMTFGSARAYACPSCMIAGADRMLPPIYAWCLLSFAWFLSAAIVAERRSERFAGIPRVSEAILLVLFAGFLGMTAVGPFPLLLLMAAPMAFYARAVALGRSPQRSAALADWSVVGSLLMAMTLTLMGWSVYQSRTRTEAQFIVQWPGSAQAVGAFARLQKREPASLSEYRYIVQHGRGAYVRRAAERIAILEGKPE
jgi:hypothetical protein